MADDLLECIGDKLNKLQVPPRLNLLLVIDAILISSNRANAQTWANLLKKNIVSTVTVVIPETPGGDSNVPQVRKVVSGWKRKSVFDKSIMEKLDKLLEKRGGGDSGGGGGSANESGMKHQEILKRIEEDRERHKRHKEDVWIRPPDELPENELEMYWDTASDFNDADWQEIVVENEEYQQERQLAEMARRSV
ncbi:hypothetical protein GGI21_005216 [Coemansia aciculifera]|nr:hypothetical protein GGI21_005216 [Coemansia aciculifera]